MNPWLQLIISIIGTLVIAVPSVLGLFRFLGEKWLDNKFAERLEKLKHEQNRELQDYKYKIDALFSRVSKIHEKEFEVFPTVWEKSMAACGAWFAIDPLSGYFPNFAAMNEGEIKRLLESEGFTVDEQDRLVKARGQDTEGRYAMGLYSSISRAHRFVMAKRARIEFHNYFISNRIFLSKDLQKEFEKLDTILNGSIIEKEISIRSEGPELTEKDLDTNKNLQAVLDQIDDLVQKRLHIEEAV